MLRPHRFAPVFAFAVVAATLTRATAPACAEEAWLIPTPAVSTAGASWSVTGYTGPGFRGTARPFARERSTRFEMRDRPGQTASKSTALGGLAREADTTWVTGAFVDARGAMIMHESAFTSRTLPGGEFDDYLKREGLESVRRSRAAAIMTDAPGRERWRRVMKTWIGGTKPEKSRATTPFWASLEIVPEGVPGAEPKLTFTVLDHGRQQPGVLVRVWHRRPGAPADSLAPVLKLRTDAKGRAVLTLPEPGTWLLSAVNSVPANLPEVDWETTWSSLTFVR